jgi:NADPH-dependent 2,4-dienoyl-CoA reductase/sulfur reductase-like enzyme
MPSRRGERRRIAVVKANEEEVAAHEHALALLDKASAAKRCGERMKLLVTGAAGFIGFHTARALLERGDEVVGDRQPQRLLRS